MPEQFKAAYFALDKEKNIVVKQDNLSVSPNVVCHSVKMVDGSTILFFVSKELKKTFIDQQFAYFVQENLKVIKLLASPRLDKFVLV